MMKFRGSVYLKVIAPLNQVSNTIVYGNNILLGNNKLILW